MKQVKNSIVAVLIAALLVGFNVAPAQAAVQDDILTAVNQQRTAAGVPALRRDATLDAAAQEWAETMRRTGRFEHSSNQWRAERIPAGWNSHGENIAYGYSSASAVMNGWMNSQGHRANILRPGYTRLGVGYVASGNYWVQIFAGYSSDPAVQPEISPAPVGRVAGTAREGAPLTAVPGTWAANTRFTYQWYLDGAVVAGATASTYTPPASAVGKRASAAVTGNLSGFAATTRMSTSSGIIQAAIPEISPAPQGRVAGSARVGAPLTAVPGTWQSGTAFTYQWFVNGVAVSGATGVTFTPTQAQVSGRATVAVTGTLTGRAPTTRLSTPSGIIQAVPDISPAPVGRVAGSARAGLPLTAVPGEWAPGVSFAYQWRVNGVPVEGATGVTFTPVAAQAGGRATVVITGTRAGFAPTVRVSTASGVIQAPFPQISPAPQGRPAGSARVGAPLTAVPGTWESGTAFSYQWFVNGVAVSGATRVTFTPTQAHVSGRATVAVTGTLTGRTPTTRLSTPSGIIQP